MEASSISAADIRRNAAPGLPVGVEHDGHLDESRPVAQGWLASQIVQPGLQASAAHYDAVQSYAVRSIAQTGFHIGINLGARSRSDIGRQMRGLRRNEAVAVAFRQPEEALAYRRAGDLQARCSITIAPSWAQAGGFDALEADCASLRAVASRHLAPHVGQATPGLLAAATHLGAALSSQGAVGRLRREAATLSFLAEALAWLGEHRPDEARTLPAASERRRIQRVKDRLDALDHAEEVRLQQLASEAGMSVRSLCRHFRSSFGQTVCGYVADLRMDAAREKLAGEAITVDQAAYLAGYAHTPSFSRAFRRRFGHPPSGLATQASDVGAHS